MLLNALVKQGGSSDEGWLQLLINGNFDEQELIKNIQKNESPLENLAPIAQLIAWIIVTHHRLPALSDKHADKHVRNKKTEVAKINLQSMLSSITAEWGYENKFNETDYKKCLNECFKFSQGLLSRSEPWINQLKKWASKLLDSKAEIIQLIENGTYRLLLHHSRLCLMLGDHYYSSCEAEKIEKWNNSIDLYANTEYKNGKPILKQKLDEHLVNVSKYALQIARTLPRFNSEMDFAYDIKKLKQKSTHDFFWQDKAVEKIKTFKKEHEILNEKGYGWFIVNMASTGKGKTFANAKIMQALSDDTEGLRYILALGLRTLTLQTGDEYRHRIGLNNDELAVLIGSSAIKELHEINQKKSEETILYEEEGSESKESLLEEELDASDAPTADFLDVLFPKNNPKLANKNKSFLYKPVLACTIDHIIAATETIRGGKYILPSLRLLSSDLVIDEVDDFNNQDLIAISRLIHLAGMLGRKVMISSATISPALAEGLFNAYQHGWILHSLFKNTHKQIACVWINEFTTQTELLTKGEALSQCQHYQNLHRKFVNKIIKELLEQPVKRKAFIVRCDDILTEKNDLVSIEKNYFEKIKHSVIQLHQQHHTVDKKSGKKVSFGLIRMANIPPCITLTKHLLKTDWPENFAPKVIAYHSRQILLLRHQQEHHLDQILKRKEKSGEEPVAFDNPIIRKHIDSTKAEHIVFILVATPVEEVGRDHDFDWAVIEPSSYRSIIQLAGRVLRHRYFTISAPNIAIMQFNLKALRKNGEPAYCHPGYETRKSLKLKSHNLCDLIDESAISESVNAIPRIQQPEILNPENKLADLEHQAMIKTLTTYSEQGLQCVQGWLNECWWLTALPQQFNPFRNGRPETSIYKVLLKGELCFCEKTKSGEYVPRDDVLRIEIEPLEEIDPYSRLWLTRDYMSALEEICSNNVINAELDMEELIIKKSKLYGELTIPTQTEDHQYRFIYSDQLGLLPIAV